jgi:hypothetical protein
MVGQGEMSFEELLLDPVARCIIPVMIVQGWLREMRIPLTG